MAKRIISYCRWYRTGKNNLCKILSEKIVVLLSATPKILQEYFSGRITRTYTFKVDYSYIERFMYYRNKDAIYGILNGVPDGEKAIIFGSNKDRLKRLTSIYSSKAAYIDSANKNKSEEAQNIVNYSKFNCKFLFCTKVLDNGINIIDSSVKTIIIEMDDLIEFQQCLGRKRIVGENDKIKLLKQQLVAVN